MNVRSQFGSQSNRSRRSRGGRPAWMRFIPIVIALVGIAGRSQLGNRSSNSGQSSGKNSGQVRTQATFGQQQQGPAKNDQADSGTTDYSVGFASKSKFDQHFVKHGAEFPGLSQSEYLRTAQEMRDAPLSGSLIEARQARGNISRFDRTSGAFLAYGDNKTIFTFFRPNDGEAYFNRAAKRKV
jgi:hypothetical protein